MLRVMNLIKRVFGMFRKNDIENVFGVKIDRSETMTAAVDKWLGMYCQREGLKLPAAIASETARLVTLEMKSEISGSKRAEYLNELFKLVLENIRKTTELAAAGGGIMFKPYMSGDGLHVDVVRPDMFIPVEFNDDGDITAIIFIDRKQNGVKYYTRLEYHKRIDDTYTVINKAFVSENVTDLGRQIPLMSVNEWADITPEISLDNVSIPLFSYFRMPMANNVDLNSPLGVSVFDRGISQIHDVNEQYKRLIWEFDSGERFVGISTTAMRPGKDGKIRMPQKEQRLIKLFEWDDSNTDGLFKEWTPTIREQNYINGMNEMLRKLEFNCGLAYGTLSDVSENEKTAEEIKASKQRSYSHISDIQKQLEKALTRLIAAMDIYVTLYNLAPSGEYSTAFEWDDSIIADRKAEFTEKQELVVLGVMQPWEMRMWYFGEDEEEAKKNVGYVDLTEE